MSETCWAVFERRAINLGDWYIWLVDLFECMMMHGLTNPKITSDLWGKVCGNVRYMKLAQVFVKWPDLASSVLNLRVLLPNGHVTWLWALLHLGSGGEADERGKWPWRHDVNGTLVNKVIINAGFHTRKDFSSNCPQNWSYALKTVCRSSSRPNY
jgi:hypothetical protein